MKAFILLMAFVASAQSFAGTPKCELTKSSPTNEVVEKIPLHGSAGNGIFEGRATYNSASISVVVSTPIPDTTLTKTLVFITVTDDKSKVSVSGENEAVYVLYENESNRGVEVHCSAN